MKKTILIGFIIAILPYGALFGQSSEKIYKTGTTAAQFLKIGVDARATGMGGAVTAMTSDLSSMYWNPGGLGYLNGIQTTFMHSNWLADINFNYLAIAFEVPNLGVIGASITGLSSPDDLVRTVEAPDGTGELFNSSDLAISLSLARQLTDKFSIGGSVKYIYQRIWHSKASAVAVDIGAVFITPFSNIRLGASITNFGGKMRLDGRDLNFSYDPDPNNQGNVEFVNALYETDRFELPLLFRVGLAGELVQNDNLRLTLAVDALHPNDNSESINAGTELALNETFMLRAGYSTLFRKDTQEGLTLGAGIHYRFFGSSTVLLLDYSYTDFGVLKEVQRFSVGLRF